MLEYKNLYFRLLHPNGTSEMGVIFKISSADVGFSASDAGGSEQPFSTSLQTEISQALPEPTVVMDFGDAPVMHFT